MYWVNLLLLVCCVPLLFIACYFSATRRPETRRWLIESVDWVAGLLHFVCQIVAVCVAVVAVVSAVAFGIAAGWGCGCLFVNAL